MHDTSIRWIVALLLVWGSGCSDAIPDMPRRHESASHEGSFQPQLEGRADLEACPKGQTVELQDCYDGDTCDFEGLDESVRLARIDTPEMHHACHTAAVEARSVLMRMLVRADRLCLDIQFEGHFGRHISELYADGTNVSDAMLQSEHAVEYGQSTCRRASTSTSEESSDDECPQNYSCSDLATCEAAQARLEKCGDGLDADGDGVPCESMCAG
jgi:endonuclease YncB( thermonuclease family)